MNNLDQIIGLLQAQQPTLHSADELTDRIMQSLPEQPAKQKPLLRRWAIAASIAVIFCLGVAAVTIYHFAPKATGEAPSSEVAATEAPAPKLDFFVFDNVEMQAVADTLSQHYNLQPVFQSEAIKKMRVYLKVDKKKKIEEMVELLNDLDEFTVTVSDGKLIIK